MINTESLFGEESEQQIVDLIENQDSYVWRIRETSLIAVVNKIGSDEELLEKFRFNETYRTLYQLYAYGKGYKKNNSIERKKLNRAYTFFRNQLAKQGKLIENLDLFIA